MKKIYLQGKSPVVRDSLFTGKLLTDAKGGNAYDFHTVMALRKKFDLCLDEKAILDKGENVWKYWCRMKSNDPCGDVIIKDPFPLVFGKLSKNAKQVAMIHHIDDVYSSKSLRHRWFYNRLKKRLQKMDLIITVAEYWKNYLGELGCKNIKVIYNSFDPQEYILADDEIKKFKSKYQFHSDIPLLYIGNAHRPKGVYEVYEALRNSPYQLVMTGAINRATDLPVKFLKLDRHDYLCLLNASDVVITMSTMMEGWSRVAHESLLSKTPVIGSGMGGMRELLEGAGQKIVTDSSKLPTVVKDVLKNKNYFAEKGFNYVAKYDSDYFEKEWINTITDLINS